MTEATDQDTSIKIVYLGACVLQGGKAGALWIPKATLDEFGPDAYDEIRRRSSPFAAKTAKGSVVGGIYDTKAEVKSGRLETASFGFSAKYVGRSDHKSIAVFEAQDWRERQREKSATAERKAKADTLVQRQLEYTIRWIKSFPAPQRRHLVDAIHSQLLDAVYRS